MTDSSSCVLFSYCPDLQSVANESRSHSPVAPPLQKLYRTWPCTSHPFKWIIIVIIYVVIIINWSQQNANSEELGGFFPVWGFLEQRYHMVSWCLYLFFLPLENILFNLDHVLIIAMQMLEAMHNVSNWLHYLYLRRRSWKTCWSTETVTSHCLYVIDRCSTT